MYAVFVGESPGYHVSVEPEATGTARVQNERQQAGLAIKLEMDLNIGDRRKAIFFLFCLFHVKCSVNE